MPAESGTSMTNVLVNLEQTRATSSYSKGAQRAPDGSSAHDLKISATPAVTQVRKLLSKFTLTEGIPRLQNDRPTFHK